MISWDRHLRLTAKMLPERDRVIACVEGRRFASLFCYGIVYCGSMVSVMNMGELMFRYYRNCPDDVRVIGIAESKQAALDLLQSIIEEVYSNTSDVDVVSYYKQLEGGR